VGVGEKILSYYPLNEASGSVITDGMGLRNGTLVGTPDYRQHPVVLGNDSDGYSMGMTDAYVNLGHPEAFLLSQWALEAWAVADTNPGGAALWAREYAGGTPVVQFEMGADIDGFGLGTINLKGGFYNGTSWALVTDPTALVIGKRYHVVYTWDGTTNRLYVNGTEVDSDVPGISPALQAGVSQDYFVGRRHDAGAVTTWIWPGPVEMAAIYSLPLTAGEVLGNYNAGVGQAARPSADVATTGWTATPLSAKIDEADPGGDVITATAA
jgi:hypothetical protein